MTTKTTTYRQILLIDEEAEQRFRRVGTAFENRSGSFTLVFNADFDIRALRDKPSLTLLIGANRTTRERRVVAEAPEVGSN